MAVVVAMVAEADWIPPVQDKDEGKMTVQSLPVDHPRMRRELLHQLRGGWEATPTAVLVVLPCVLAVLLTLPRLGLKSLWIDEAWVAVAIQRGTFGPAALSSTPEGLALLVAGLSRVVGPTEFWLRFIPFLFAIGAIPLTFLAAYRFYHARSVAFIASLLLATNFGLISYAMMLKPYTADIFFSILLVLLVERIIVKGTTSNWVVYVCAVGVALPFSFTSVFVTTVGAATLLVLALYNSRRQLIAPWLVSHSLIAIVLGLYALVFLRSQSTAGLQSYWSSGFPPHTGALHLVAWYARQTMQLLEYLFNSFVYFFAPFTPFRPLGWGSIVVVVRSVCAVSTILLLLWGAYATVKKHSRYLALLAGPVAVVALASLMHLYPFDPRSGGRLLLFTLPGLVIIYGSGVAALLATTRARTLGLVVLAFALIPGAFTVGASVVRPLDAVVGTETEQMGSLVTHNLLPDLQRGDLVYVYYEASAEFQYYAPRFRQQVLDYGDYRVIHLNGVTVVFGASHPALGLYGLGVQAAINRWSPHRVWMIFGRKIVPKNAPLSEEDALVSAVVRCDPLVQTMRQEGATLYHVNVMHPSSCSTR